MRCRRRLLHGALLVILLPALASCSRATPLCDYADGLVGAAELVGAADAYAAAQEADEGDCGKDGLARVGTLRASAGTYVAKGRVAARAGKTAAATASFKAALAVDRSDDAAGLELQRLTRVSPAPTAPVSTVVVAGPQTTRSNGDLPWIALAVALLAALASAIVWRRSRHAIEEAQQNAATQVTEARTDLDRRLDDLETDLVNRITAAEGQAATADGRAVAAGRAAEAFRDDVASLVITSIRALRDDGTPRIEEQYVPRSRETT
ncbi:hypothetical protein AB0C12_42640 [Actinoplanes sp. NPDC048967]|uniref:hypothetical protein n=1 Tax=Actinoplanes sp. NPDC048967 TaxID=3155269 RepID=UPI0033CF2458